MNLFSLMAKVTTVTAVFPDTVLPQIPIQSKTSDNGLKQTMFHTENARILSVFYVNLLFLSCGCTLPRWLVVFRVVMGKLIYYGALRLLCARCAETPQLKVFCIFSTHWHGR